ncbi:uncharacterized protein LOC112128398 [Cimex lectularius]|uniref:Uncharacterized protein n=1 Tax=Cimex lectularius TaxID=79782 RepID=A0A8I6SSA5_CIMLE|nr:uncharacterized protein LOC112128398 [Cimex lectularius]
MYSLYRGWLKGEENEAVVMITVGVGEESRQFSGRRTLLAHHSGYIKSLLENSQRNHISVPSISPHVFAAILNFINTGFLDLNPENIYSILLATHLLHMPRAVEICRNYLLGERLRNPSPNLVKPIPSRKYIPTALYWPPPPPPHFFSAPIPPPFGLPPYNVPHVVGRSGGEDGVPEEAGGHEPTAGEDPVPSTSVERPPPPPPPTLHDFQRDRSPGFGSHSSDTVSVKSNKGVLKDIACCDGPVRFKRVLNLNYGVLSDSENNSKDGENGRNDTDNKRVFICGFCKHTFKSHYCYRKHTRRHLNPVTLSAVNNPEKDTKDMNVQYYPCKTCGSKFPSYYFVHKHRKLCHANEPFIKEKLPSNNSQNEEPAE